MEIEHGNTIEIINTIENKNEIYKKNKRLYLSYIVTIVQFIAMILQIIKYGTSGKAMVSGWSKVMQNLICGTNFESGHNKHTQGISIGIC